MLTETWFQVGVETVESARGRGLGRAAAMGIIVDRVLRGLRPVLRVPASNVPATRLARRLGFEAVDLHWLLTRT
jgi:predicted GNAT family acetyltransferase